MVDLPSTSFNIRWYHVMSMVAFMVANLFNFQLNRWWTFGSHRHSGWWREYWPFLTVGLIAARRDPHGCRRTIRIGGAPAR